MSAERPVDATPVLAALLHKLGSPLGAVANYSYLLEGGPSSEAVEGIQTGVARAKTLIVAARRWIDRLSYPATPGTDDAAAELRGAADAVESPLIVDVDALPPLLVSAVAWSTICAELFANAQQAADELVHVVVAGTVENGVARISFRDNGPGWTADDAGRAFGYFVTLDPASPRAGMGLPIVADLAARHGGRAWGEPGPEGGAIVHVELPSVV